MSGRGTLSTAGADDQIDRLAKKYLGEDKYPWAAEADVRIGVTLAIDKIDAFGFDA